MEELHEDIPKTTVEQEKTKLSQLLENVKKEMLAGKEDMQAFEKLKKVLENINLSFIENINYETSGTTTKRRKISNDEKFLEDIKKQIDIVKNALNVIYDIESTSFKTIKQAVGDENVFFKRLTEHGQALPLWVDTDGEDPPPLCGSIKAEESHISNVGDLVAAFVVKENTGVWILAEVTAYDPEKKEYTVDDIYEEKLTEQNVSWDKVIPLPKMKADPENNQNALFREAEIVLALYPNSTCFYEATVRKVPKSHEDPYGLLFSGTDEVMQWVHQRFVINNKKVQQHAKE